MHRLRTALHKVGGERIFQEKAPGGRWDRLELQRLIEHLKAGDVVVVFKLDRLSRSLKDLLLTLEKIEPTEAIFLRCPLIRLHPQILQVPRNL